MMIQNNLPILLTYLHADKLIILVNCLHANIGNKIIKTNTPSSYFVF